ncbi:MAG TPA: hypothetical protein VK921_05570 [Anditalea sp.]|nr:hypothetical protein [Anditalea sp.]
MTFHFIHFNKSYLIIYGIVLILSVSCASSKTNETGLNDVGLELQAIGKQYNYQENEIEVYQTLYSTAGSTSVRNVDKSNLKWKDQGYFQRNRDIGQVFTPSKDILLKAVILRTGPSETAVLSETPGAKVFMQFFEIEGDARINDNNTPPGSKATHGFTDNHRADDFIEGIVYKPLFVAKGGIFPDLPVTFRDNEATGNEDGKLYYIRWALGEPQYFKSGKSYAFIVGFEEPSDGLGFTLANYNRASDPGPAILQAPENPYKEGWSIRREGNGNYPPLMVPGENPPTDNIVLQALYDESLFATDIKRYLLQPTTDGYPDVDTYRDLEFALEIVNK